MSKSGKAWQDKRPKSQSSKAPANGQQRPVWLAPTLAVVGLLLIGVAALLIGLMKPPPAAEPSSGAPEAALVGAVDECRSGPRFQTALNLSPQAALATTFTNVKGLAIFDPAGNNGQGSLYQHPTWDDAGFLGPFITDRRGDIYVAPAPLVSVVENPPELQNRIYRVDSNNQEMALFLDLPWSQPPSGGNPFGVVGLAYDCETESLYATSLAGSTASQQLGRIFRIDLKTGQVTSQLDGIDAMGVSAFNGAEGKRLYYGLARSPEVYSVALDAQGNFVGEPRLEYSFAGDTVGGRRTARRIRFSGADTMRLSLMDFNYSLQVASARQEDVVTLGYDADSDSWNFLKIDAAQ